MGIDGGEDRVGELDDKFGSGPRYPFFGLLWMLALSFHTETFMVQNLGQLNQSLSVKTTVLYSTQKSAPFFQPYLIVSHPARNRFHDTRLQDHIEVYLTSDGGKSHGSDRHLYQARSDVQDPAPDPWVDRFGSLGYPLIIHRP